jgi:putative FmdB family regulatory protein
MEDHMPTYAYACTACDHRFEAVQSFSDDALSVCPECSGRLRKVFGAVGVVFKGSGFYRTDSRSTSAKGAPKKAETAASTAPAKESTSSTSSSSSSTSTSSSTTSAA